MRAFAPNRLVTALLILLGIFFASLSLHAQDQSEPSLGDLARSLRKKPLVTETVIDNDNLSNVMDEVETQRMNGWSSSSSSIFSLTPVAKSFQISSPDVTCSLAFSGKKDSSESDPFLLEDLPRSELAKLDGPATIDGDSLQVSMHNASAWDVREVVIGLTIVRHDDSADAASRATQPRIIPAATGSVAQQAPDASQKPPDVTLLLHAKGSAAPSSTAVFRTALNFALFPDQEWHWAIVRAKGIPPSATTTITQTAAGTTTRTGSNPPQQEMPTLPVPPSKPQPTTTAPPSPLGAEQPVH
jgi:hypothetical protein